MGYYYWVFRFMVRKLAGKARKPIKRCKMNTGSLHSGSVGWLGGGQKMSLERRAGAMLWETR